MKPRVLTTLATLTALVLTGCAGSSLDVVTAPSGAAETTAEPAGPAPRLDEHDPRTARFFTSVAYGASWDEVKVFPDLAAAASAASVVLVAKVMGVAVSRELSFSDGNSVTYTGVTLKPEQVLRGELPPQFTRSLVVEFLSSPETADAMKAQLPDGYGVYFLNQKVLPPLASRKPGSRSVDESRFFRLASSQGLFVQGEDGLVNPVSPVGTPGIGLDGQLEAAPPRDAAVAEGERFTKLSDLVAYLQGTR